MPPVIPIPPDGCDFAELMALEKIGENTFRSIAKPCPGGPRVIDGKNYITTYGGHVYAQAAWAAAQTVGEGCVIHNTSGYFLSPGLSTHPFTYTTTPLRTGRTITTLTVTATQPTSPLSPRAPCFTATISLKRPSTPPLTYQTPPSPSSTPLTRFATLLHGRHPRALPRRTYADMWAVVASASRAPHRSASLPGLSWAQLPYAAAERAQARMANMYAVTGRLGRAVNLHVCAHLYASDRETIYTVARQLGVWGRVEAVASVSHKVVVHELGEGVMFGEGEEGGEGEKWFCQEVWTDRWADGRVVVHGRIYDVDTGKHVASTMQDGILKADFGGDDEEVERVREGFERGVVAKKARAKM
ncbi:Acyl-CoA thioesterase II [Neofusicoccum parvum]|uniref:Acyl-CoA thioesterase II n=1 Tax=Neofusicoccum parvum TaxID=310453 RepID=A0ACB5RZ94_9PEZI|nr:Acyl-CoA thioesterase II [Neofusicoccum parvum]